MVVHQWREFRRNTIAFAIHSVDRSLDLLRLVYRNNLQSSISDFPSLYLFNLIQSHPFHAQIWHFHVSRSLVFHLHMSGFRCPYAAKLDAIALMIDNPNRLVIQSYYLL